MLLMMSVVLLPSALADHKIVWSTINDGGGVSIGTLTPAPRAKDFSTGVVLGKNSQEDSTTLPVALTGRVYCWADASNAPIEAGDLLTTSDIPGHAMKVTDYAKAQGAILGKAMSSLESGRGLVLVTLQ
jgi:hypothetical protein